MVDFFLKPLHSHINPKYAGPQFLLWSLALVVFTDIDQIAFTQISMARCIWWVQLMALKRNLCWFQGTRDEMVSSWHIVQTICGGRPDLSGQLECPSICPLASPTQQIQMSILGFYLCKGPCPVYHSQHLLCYRPIIDYYISRTTTARKISLIPTQMNG